MVERLIDEARVGKLRLEMMRFKEMIDQARATATPPRTAPFQFYFSHLVFNNFILESN